MQRLKPDNILKYIIALSVILILINIVGLIFNCRYISIFAAAHDADTYEIRSRLLMEAMNDIGACSPQQAALTWAKGLKMRSAALQYSVMSKKLKEEYARELEKNNPNWVTGISSPWVESYEIAGIKTKEDTFTIKMLISTRTSTGPAGDYVALLTVSPEDGFWRIKEITADRELSPYTGLSSR